jgi:N6-adenosine-specific RNA methylase IME4
MTVDEIAAIPVLSLADDHCRLFLWATSRYLGDAFDVLERWGFKYIQTVVWKKTGNPSPFGGSVAPNHAEFFLIGKRGAPPLWTRWTSSVIEVPAAQCFNHSRKPDVFQDLVEQVSGGPYLELFARRQRLGWDTWGDEALEHVQIGDVDA